MFSSLVPRTSPVEIYYREYGSGTPMLFLHGGWGYEVYDFSRQIEALSGSFRIIIPDRSGYGRSSRIDRFPTDFHQHAAAETGMFLDALNIDRAVLWGHSDGAVIATMLALAERRRCIGLILEAFHFYRVKNSSLEFFEVTARDPETLGDRVAATLAREHGEDYWKKLVLANGDAWLRINLETLEPKQDLYGGRLSELSVPTIFIHGARDPRTEPDELEAIRKELPLVRIHLIETGGHSPHSGSSTAEECTRVAEGFLESLKCSPTD